MNATGMSATDWEHYEAMRRLLADWLYFARTMTEAGLIAEPKPLVNATVGILDCTSC